MIIAIIKTFCFETEHRLYAAADRVELKPLPEHAANQSMEQAGEQRPSGLAEHQERVSELFSQKMFS